METLQRHYIPMTYGSCKLSQLKQHAICQNFMAICQNFMTDKAPIKSNYRAGTKLERDWILDAG